MNNHQIELLQSRKTDHWATPANLYEELDREFHFDFDPCPLHSTFDGLQVPWIGRSFVNPPYSNITAFLRKAHEELRNGNAKVVVFLVFANTDTKWFHQYVYHQAELIFVEGRVKFVDENGSNDKPAMRPSMLAIFRAEASHS